MKIEFSERFLEQDNELRNASVHNRLEKVIQRVQDAPTQRDIPNLRKLAGYTSAYRIRMGNYRIGVHIKGDTVIFADFDLRKDFYSRFP